MTFFISKKSSFFQLVWTTRRWRRVSMQGSARTSWASRGVPVLEKNVPMTMFSFSIRWFFSRVASSSSMMRVTTSTSMGIKASSWRPKTMMWWRSWKSR